jgi:ActR/RegA family two-component response regulator
MSTGEVIGNSSEGKILYVRIRFTEGCTVGKPHNVEEADRLYWKHIENIYWKHIENITSKTKEGIGNTLAIR